MHCLFQQKWKELEARGKRDSVSRRSCGVVVANDVLLALRKRLFVSHRIVFIWLLGGRTFAHEKVRKSGFIIGVPN